MKHKIIFSLIVAIAFISCNQKPKADNQAKENAALKAENDSLKKVVNDSKISNETIKDSVITEPAVYPKAGKHPITLQWISWDKPGEVLVKPLTNDWYSISGSQRNEGGDFLTIEGKIKRLSEKELEFEGTITTKVSSIYGGEPCIKTGKQKFYAKGNRQYFRLQNMTNCEGGMLVDYVDIYMGTSSL